METLKGIIRSLFNLNTGYFIKPVTYFYNGEYNVGYILCKGYKIFGVTGYDRIDTFIDCKEAQDALNKLISEK